MTDSLTLRLRLAVAKELDTQMQAKLVVSQANLDTAVAKLEQGETELKASSASMHDPPAVKPGTAMREDGRLCCFFRITCTQAATILHGRRQTRAASYRAASSSR